MMGKYVGQTVSASNCFKWGWTQNFSNSAVHNHPNLTTVSMSLKEKITMKPVTGDLCDPGMFVGIVKHRHNFLPFKCISLSTLPVTKNLHLNVLAAFANVSTESLSFDSLQLCITIFSAPASMCCGIYCPKTCLTYNVNLFMVKFLILH